MPLGGTSLRRILFWIHLTAGITAGAVIFVMAFTGVLLSFERQLTAWADGDRIERPAAPRLPIRAVLGRAQDEAGAAASLVVVHADPARPVEVGFGRERRLFLDPYRGTVLGEGSAVVRRFFDVVTRWHRWLGAAGEDRATGRALTGGSNLVFLFILLSGLTLWWPRQWSRRQLRSVALFQPGLRGRARDFNWHNVLGLWCALPLALIVASAVLISYPWANDLLYRAFGEEPPARRERRRASLASPYARAGTIEGLERAWATAERHVPAWRTISLRLPPDASAPLTFSIDTSSGAARPDRRAQLTVDRTTGALLRFEPYSAQSPARRVRAWARWVHTGEAGGIAGQAVAGLASAGAVVLASTGLALAWRRFRGWAERRTRPRTLHQPTLRSDQT